jgi:hypothetical protein
MLDLYEEIGKNLGSKCQTPYESCFLTLLLDSGIYTKALIEAQVKLYEGNRYKYRADFLITNNNNTKIVVEIDGSHHYYDHKQKQRDDERTRQLSSSGFYVFRFTNQDVVNMSTEDIEWLIDIIRGHN